VSFAGGAVDKDAAGERVNPPPAEAGVERAAEQHRAGEQPVDRDAAFGRPGTTSGGVVHRAGDADFRTQQGRCRSRKHRPGKESSTTGATSQPMLPSFAP
jgi:hypothetical protein